MTKVLCALGWRCSYLYWSHRLFDSRHVWAMPHSQDLVCFGQPQRLWFLVTHIDVACTCCLYCSQGRSQPFSQNDRPHGQGAGTGLQEEIEGLPETVRAEVDGAGGALHGTVHNSILTADGSDPMSVAMTGIDTEMRRCALLSPPPPPGSGIWAW